MAAAWRVLCRERLQRKLREQCWRFRVIQHLENLRKNIDKLTHIIYDLKEEMYMVAVGSSLVGLCEVGLDSSASTTKSSLIDYFVVGLSLAGLCEIGLDSKGFQGKNR